MRIPWRQGGERDAAVDPSRQSDSLCSSGPFGWSRGLREVGQLLGPYGTEKLLYPCAPSRIVSRSPCFCNRAPVARDKEVSELKRPRIGTANWNWPDGLLLKRKGRYKSGLCSDGFWFIVSYVNGCRAVPFHALPHAVDRRTRKSDPATTTSASSASSFPYLLKGSTIPPSVGMPSFAWRGSGTHLSHSHFNLPVHILHKLREKSSTYSLIHHQGIICRSTGRSTGSRS